jgi:hypothetical protein
MASSSYPEQLQNPDPYKRNECTMWLAEQLSDERDKERKEREKERERPGKMEVGWLGLVWCFVRCHWQLAFAAPMHCALLHAHAKLAALQ